MRCERSFFLLPVTFDHYFDGFLAPSDDVLAVCLTLFQLHHVHSRLVSCLRPDSLPPYEMRSTSNRTFHHVSTLRQVSYIYIYSSNNIQPPCLFTKQYEMPLGEQVLCETIFLRCRTYLKNPILCQY